MTTYIISDDRFSPTEDIVTADEFRAYCEDMNEMNGWEIDLDSIDIREDGIYYCGELIAPVETIRAANLTAGATLRRDGQRWIITTIGENSLDQILVEVECVDGHVGQVNTWTFDPSEAVRVNG